MKVDDVEERWETGAGGNMTGVDGDPASASPCARIAGASSVKARRRGDFGDLWLVPHTPELQPIKPSSSSSLRSIHPVSRSASSLEELVECRCRILPELVLARLRDDSDELVAT